MRKLFIYLLISFIVFGCDGVDNEQDYYNYNTKSDENSSWLKLRNKLDDLFESSIQETMDTDTVLLDDDIKEKEVHQMTDKKTEFNFECVDFFRISYGRIQSVDKNDDIGICRLGQCVSNENSFDVVWLLNKSNEERLNISTDELKRNYEMYASKDTSDDLFKVFYFKLPMKQVDDLLLDDPYYFPVVVEIFIQDNRGFEPKFLKKETVSNWDEYVQLQYLILSKN